MKTAFLFPGQGAQYPGMGQDLYQESAAVRELFAAAQDTVDFPVADTLFQGSEDDLKRTDITQVAITLVNLSAAAVLRDRGILPDAVAGFSLGEYAALVTAGVLRLQDVFPLVKARGEIMAEESRMLADAAGAPGMAAVIGLAPEAVTAALAGRDDVFPANLNSPKQTVISGTAAGLEAARDLLKEAGARRIIVLKVSGPFHSPLMQPARDRIAGLVADLPFHDPQLPLYSNVTGRPIPSGEDAKRLCLEHITSPVRWVEEQTALLQDGCERFLEVGPGSVLGGLMQGLLKDFPQEGIEVQAAGTIDEITSINQ
ncbi:ACP S-malonyltransferase [Spirochaeta africana]|uniref:Malonyl CoA-acyl carrier protein transacylase n=1 Tax=Spirochaeta africana (strain ATCC 700263 / DSM 8902 / Z-7692) TaxID=889378 RepID=H9UFR2_SPIAZ|nr:ACP S-malonyltransferase [Spirochaeta africana]AFG36355.1 malonyl CoA-acyl carrier protein transacylase [Spirochaeta africana DSM 8902]